VLNGPESLVELPGRKDWKTAALEVLRISGHDCVYSEDCSCLKEHCVFKVCHGGIDRVLESLLIHGCDLKEADQLPNG